MSIHLAVHLAVHLDLAHETLLITSTPAIPHAEAPPQTDPASPLCRTQDVHYSLVIT